jgi:DNA repair protein RadA/Sms
LLQKDVFVNIAGGIRVNDPAIDLAVLAAVLSSNMDIALDEYTCVTGEVGLSGEIRPVNRIDQRIKEAEKLGFERIIVPFGQKYDPHNLKIKVLEVSRVAEAFKILLHK